uniref:Methylated-DNA--protein-cysteine methyltransferase n=1 Tax=Timema californicum TaxID=61474 RepID=A0A7R9J6B0_TIMCA|nr:unnamed protein product [Timema californicum]
MELDAPFMRCELVSVARSTRNHGKHRAQCINDLHRGGNKRTFRLEGRVTVTLMDKIRPKDGEIVDQVLYWLKIYFNDVQAINHTFMPSLCPSAGANTNFRTQVCQVLSKNVGPGKTVSYSELASLINKPNAARAVGTAMANNPIQLIIPCHRVIRNDLSLGNYARGQKVKMWLLKHEGVKLAANNKVLPVPGSKKRPTKTVVLP